MTQKQLTATLDGNMRFTAVNPAGRTLVMDDYEGGGGPSPIETILASLAGCTGMDVVSILRKKRVPFTGYRVETTADQVETYPQVFTRVDVTHVVEGTGISPEAVHRAVELSALKYCPVSAMLAAGTVEIHHGYRIVAPDGTATDAECVVRGPHAPAEALIS
ncbi:MAG TPA: OsmC family protein [Candidatus Limnocylindrales bacterium]|jgi:putative redox protein|nr:OsmC family protein [Candidatus Limnocylindrales bacterium]